jgi:hypothetical protein
VGVWTWIPGDHKCRAYFVIFQITNLFLGRFRLFKFSNLSLGFRFVVPSHIVVYSSSVVSCEKQMSKNFTNFNKLVAGPFNIKGDVIYSSHLQPTKNGISARRTPRIHVVSWQGVLMPLVVKDTCMANVKDVAGTVGRCVRIQHSDLCHKKQIRTFWEWFMTYHLISSVNPP